MKTGRKSLMGRSRALLVAAAAVAVSAVTGNASAQTEITFLPGGQMVNISFGGMTFTTTADRAWADMARFNIAAGDTITIAGTPGSVLFNISDTAMTFMRGTLNATNHKVYLTNPMGIELNGNLNVGGLYAVGGSPDFTATEFVNKTLGNAFSFDTSNANGLVTNMGTITAGGVGSTPAAVHLLGNRVHNAGNIVLSSQNAVATLLADQTSVTVTELANNRVSVRLDTTDITDANGDANINVANAAAAPSGLAGVTNSGSISTLGIGSVGQVVLGAGDMYSLAIDNTGTGSIDAAGGTVQMTGLDGQVRHSGDLTAGTLDVDGENVLLTSDINANKTYINNAALLGANVTIEGETTGSEAAEVEFGSTVDSFSLGIPSPKSLTVRSADTVFGDSVGFGSSLSSLSVTGDTTLMGAVTTTSGPGGMSFGGDVTLNRLGIAADQTISAQNGQIVFGGDVTKLTIGDLSLAGMNTAGMFDAITFNAGVDQLVDVTGGRMTILGGMQKTGAGDLTLAGIGSNGITFTGDPFDGSRAENTVGRLVLDGNVVVNGPGDLTLGGDGGISLLADISTQDGDLTFLDDVTFDALGIATAQSATANMGQLIFDGNVMKTTTGALALEGDDGIFAAGDVSTMSGNLNFGNDVEFDSLGIGTAQMVTAGGAGQLQFDGNATKSTSGALTLAADGGISAAGDVTTTDGNLTFDDSVSFTGAAGQVARAVSGQLQLNGTATKATGDLTLGGMTIDLNGNVESTAGALTIENAANAAGDLVAGTNLVLDGEIQLDGAVSQTLRAGTLIDANGDINKVQMGDLHVDAMTGTIDAEGNIVNATLAGGLILSGDTAMNVAGDLATLDGTLAVTDALTLDGGVPQAIASVTGLVDLDGSVTKTNSGGLNIFSSLGMIDAEGDLTNTVGGINLQQAGGAGINFAGGMISTSGGPLNVNSALTLDGGFQRLLTNGGDATFAGDVTKTSAGTLLVNVAAGRIDINGNIAHNGAVVGDKVELMSSNAAQDAIALSGDLTMAGGFGAVADGNLQLDGIDQIIIANGLDVLGNLTKTTSGALVVNTLSDEQNYNGDFTHLGTATTDTVTLTSTAASSDAIEFEGNASTAGGNFTLNGNVRVDGAAGTNQMVTSAGVLDINGNITSQFGSSYTLAGVDTAAGMNDGVQLSGNATNIGPGAIAVNGNLQLDGVDQTFTADALDFNGNVTKTTNGNTAFNGASSITLAGNAVNGPAVVGNMAFNNDLTLDGTTGDQRVDAGLGSLSLARVSKATMGNVQLGGDAGVTAGGAINVANGGLTVEDALTIAGAGGTTVTVNTTGGQSYQGAVTLMSDLLATDSGNVGMVFGSTVDGNFALAVNSAADVTFRANLGSVQRLGSLTTAVQGKLHFLGTFVMTNGDIKLNTPITIAVPATATIDAGGDLIFDSLAGNFEMGQHQKLSSLGSVNIKAQEANLGDINTLGDLVVMANTIRLLSRDPGAVAGESVADLGLDFIAGGKFFFSSIPVVNGSGVVQFANPMGDGDVNGTLQTFIMRAFGFIDGSSILPSTGALAGVFLDLRAKGPVTTNLGESLAELIPPDSQQSANDQRVPLPANIRQILSNNLGISQRAIGPEELSELVAGRTLFLDAPPQTSVDPNVSTDAILTDRILTESATAVVDAYTRLLGADRGPEQVRFDLGVAWRVYRRMAGEGNADAYGFIQFCETEPGNDQVIADLDALQELFANMKALGLTDAELQLPMDSALGLFASPDLPVRTLEAILDAMGSDQTAINMP